MVIYNLVFRTLLSQSQNDERQSVDWPVEMEKALIKFDDSELTELATIFRATGNILEEILKNRACSQKQAELSSVSQ